ncbi:SMC-Scp complex subunit ScpB [Actinomadura welshii]
MDRRLLRMPRTKLTRAALETLAVVAYRQPVTRAQLFSEQLRSSNSL